MNEKEKSDRSKVAVSVMFFGGIYVNSLVGIWRGLSDNEYSQAIFYLLCLYGAIFVNSKILNRE